MFSVTTSSAGLNESQTFSSLLSLSLVSLRLFHTLLLFEKYLFCAWIRELVVDNLKSRLAICEPKATKRTDIFYLPGYNHMPPN